MGQLSKIPENLELGEYLEEHLKECYEFEKRQQKRRTVPELYNRGYKTALWHILSKVNRQRYFKLLKEHESIRFLYNE